MAFLNPTFLWALLALAVPIIIHLFYFRRFRRVYFSNVRHLREVKEETSVRSRLRNLLVLLLRCLAVAALVVAFAQPFIPSEEGGRGGRRAVSIYIDNSFSMGAESERAPLLQLARDAARGIVSAYGPEDRFQILSNAFRGGSQRLLGQEAALEAIEQISVGPESRALSAVVARQRGALAEAEADHRVAYLLSDFQRNVTDLADLPTDTTLDMRLLPLANLRQRNVAIDSVWFEAPVPQLNANNLLLVRMTNYGGEPATNVRLSLTYNGRTNPEGTISLGPGETVTDSAYLNITAGGPGSAVLAITDFPVQFDDRYFVAFRTTDRVRVLSIDDDGDPRRQLAAALQLPVFEAATVGVQNIDYGTLGEQDLIVVGDLPALSTGLSEQLRQYVRDGGNLFLFPTAAGNVDSYNDLLRELGTDRLGTYGEKEREVSELNEQSFVFRDVYEQRAGALTLPGSRGNYTVQRAGGATREPLLTYRDGSPALSRYAVGEGNLFLSTAPLDPELNDLALDAEVFVPMLYRMGLSSGRRRPLAYTIGRDEVVEIGRRGQPVSGAGNDLVYRLRGSGGEFIPRQRNIGNRVALTLGGQIPEAGVYELSLNDDTVEQLAFNYDRRESELSYLATAELSTIAGASVLNTSDPGRLEASVRERNEGRPLWRYFVWLALSALLGEVLVLRLWRV